VKTSSVIFWGLCAVIFLIPLPFGGNEEWAIFAFEALTIILFGIHVAGLGLPRGSPENGSAESRMRFPRFFLILLAIFIFVSVFQLIPLPLGFLKILSPRAAGIYEAARQLNPGSTSASSFHPITFSQNLSLYELTKYLCYGLFGYLVYRYVATQKNIKTAIRVMIGAGLFQGAYGLIQYFRGSVDIFGWKNIHNIGSATGTFVNRNHFSGFLEMVLPLSLGYILSIVGTSAKKTARGLGEETGQRRHRPMPMRIWLGACPVIFGLGIFYSKSRSGIVSMMASFIFIIIILIIKNVRARGHLLNQKKFFGIVGLVLFIILFIVLWVGTKPVLERFNKEQMAKTGRTEYARDTLKLIKGFLFTGTGLGNFGYSYKLYEVDYGNGGILHHAHNDYLEVIAESGIIGGGSLILLVLGAFGSLLLKWMKRRESFVSGIGLGCLAGIFAILVHSLTDFNLRIPANFIYFMALYALGKQVILSGRGTHSPVEAEIKK